MAASRSGQSSRSKSARTATPKQPPVTSQANNSSESGETLSPDELARALRAVAAELERDPELARRVAGAMRLPADSPPPKYPVDTVSSTPAPDVDAAEGETLSVPALRPGKVFKPRLVTGAAPALGQGVPDPFALREQLGESGLREVLADLRLGTLRAIVREHHLDPTGKLTGQNDDAKYRALILRATKRAQRG